MKNIILFKKPMRLVTVALIMTAGCGNKEAVKTETIAEIQAREGLPVTAQAVINGPFRVTEKQGGTVKGYNQTDLGAPIPAKITAVNVKVGQRVKENDILISLDPESMAAQFSEVEKQIEQARKSYDRMAALHAEGAVSDDVYENATTQLEVAQMQLKKLKKTVNIPAPFDGTMVTVNARVNDHAAPGGGKNGPPPLAIIARLDKVVVEMMVNEASVNSYRKGQAAFIVVDRDTVNGSISDVAISGDKTNHGFSVRAVFHNRGLKVKPGMYVSVNTVTYKKKKVLQVPVAAVQSPGLNPFVFIINDKVAVKKTVRLGRRGAATYEVDGLNAADRIIVTGISRLSDGVKIKAVQ